METVARSWALAKESYVVLRRVPSLVVFPIISSIVTILITISFVVPTYVLTGGKDLKHINPVIGYPVMFLFYFLTYFVVIYFNSAMIACAYEGLSGRDTTVGYGLSVANKRIGAILGWAAISATVGVVLRTIAERSGIIGNIVIGLIGFAWNVATFFVVPVIVLEKGSPIEAVKKSTVMLKNTWGERLVVSVGLGTAMGLLVMVGALAIFGGLLLATAGGALVLGIILGVFGVLYMLVIATISAALQGIFQTAIFVYAETGNVPDGFDQDTIQSAFKTKESAISKFTDQF